MHNPKYFLLFSFLWPFYEQQLIGCFVKPDIISVFTDSRFAFVAGFFLHVFTWRQHHKETQYPRQKLRVRLINSWSDLFFLLSLWFLSMRWFFKHGHKVPLHWHKRSSVISDVRGSLRNFCFEWFTEAMMHITVFRFCLATNRQQVAQLCLGGGCQSTDKILRLRAFSDSFPVPAYILMCWRFHVKGYNVTFWLLTFKEHANSLKRKAMPIQSAQQQQRTLNSFSTPERGMNHPQQPLTPLLDRFLSNWLSVCLAGCVSLSVFWQIWGAQTVEQELINPDLLTGWLQPALIQSQVILRWRYGHIPWFIHWRIFFFLPFLCMPTRERMSCV